MIKLLPLIFENTMGGESFVDALNNTYPNYDSLWDDVGNIIDQSGSPSIKFETLHPSVGGISKTDMCIINSTALDQPILQCLFIIFHEIAHQYQYKKHGKDFALSIYVNNEPLDDIIKTLISIESTADRFGSLQTKKLAKKYNITEKFLTPDYNTPQSVNMIKQYIQQLRQIIRQKNLKNIEDINDFLYNMIKTQL